MDGSNDCLKGYTKITEHDDGNSSPPRSQTPSAASLFCPHSKNQTPNHCQPNPLVSASQSQNLKHAASASTSAGSHICAAGRIPRKRPHFSIAEEKEHTHSILLPNFLMWQFPSILEDVVCVIISTTGHGPHPKTVTAPVAALLPVSAVTFEGARIVEDVGVFFLLSPSRFLQSA